MTSDRKVEIVKSTASYFTENIKTLIQNLPEATLKGITEIRLRAGRPLSLTLNGENVFISERGHICYLSQHGLYKVSDSEIEEIFLNMCDHSVYAFTDRIKHGYITLKNGCRAGLAASAVYENGKISGFTAVSSINVRIAAEYIGCAIPIAKYLSSGLLIAGPPSAGKTTLLRDAVRIISCGNGTERRRVAVVDTRGEIAAVQNGVPQTDLGPLTDVLTCCEKQEGIEIALRTLSPQVIAFDEIGNLEEADAVIKGFHAGADALCTVHIGNVDELMLRETSKALIMSGCIKHVAFLKAPTEPISVFRVTSDGLNVNLSPAETGVCLA